MCPAKGELENGDAEKPVELLCEVAHLRARSLDIPVPAHGDCAFCQGGAGHEALLAKATWLEHRPSGSAPAAAPGARRPLPVLREAETEGGCGSCSNH